MRVNADKAIARAEAKIAEMTAVERYAMLNALYNMLIQDANVEVLYADMIEVVCEALEARLGIREDFVEHADGSITPYWITGENE